MSENIAPQLHLGDLEHRLTKELLHNYFSTFGTISLFEIKIDKNGSKFGYLSYFNPEEGMKLLFYFIFISLR